MWPELLPKTPPDKKAKEIYNSMYVAADYLADHSECIDRCNIMIDTLIESQPMYTGELNPHWKYWNDVKEAMKIIESSAK